MTFSSPLDISNSPSECSAATAVVDSHGNIDVAVSHSTPGPFLPAPSENVVFRSTANQGASFSSPTNVSGAPRFFDVSDLKIAAGSHGDIYIGWGSLFFAHSQNGGVNFSSPEILGPSSSNSLALAAGPSGSVDVAWSGAGDSSENTGFFFNTDIFFERSPRGQKLASANPTDLSGTPTQAEVTPEMVLDSLGDAYLVWQANSSSGTSSQVFFARVPASFSQPVDFTLTVSPASAKAVPGETIKFQVVGHDLDDVNLLDLICSVLPSSALKSGDETVPTGCAFDPTSISKHRSTARLTVTIPSTFLAGTYFLGVSGGSGSTVNTDTVQIRVSAPGE
jgi:hypothetical protein